MFLYNYIDKFTNDKAFKFQAISYHSPLKDEYNYLNLNHSTWVHPCLKREKHNESFIELYSIALKDTKKIITDVNSYLKDTKKINLKTVFKNYLYLNVNYEFGKDLEEDDLEKKARSYLITHDIKFNGNKIVFIVNGISTKMITINNNKTYLNNYLIILNTEEKITLKELLLSLLFSNINISLREETLKALTVLYRDEVIYNLNNDTLDLRKLSLSYHNYKYYKVN